MNDRDWQKLCSLIGDVENRRRHLAEARRRRKAQGESEWPVRPTASAIVNGNETKREQKLRAALEVLASFTSSLRAA